ncbi:uncharacterized protein LOC112651173 [Canis lupus dingo]|uniref:uncharacterized protein LOC112651173 n=1 Tax=Canis lupus dingo TaxID=286419 RepID=UPI0020C433D8|nr:uncharacterized protein LOC112651173 [Canis lupus dingo]
MDLAEGNNRGAREPEQAGVCASDFLRIQHAKKSLCCLLAASGASLAVADPPPPPLLFHKPRFSPLGHMLTVHWAAVGEYCHPAWGLEVPTKASLLSLLCPLAHPSVISLPGCCLSLPIARTSWRAGAGLRPGSSAPVFAGSVNEGGHSCSVSCSRVHEVEITGWGSGTLSPSLSLLSLSLSLSHTHTHTHTLTCAQHSSFHDNACVKCSSHLPKIGGKSPSSPVGSRGLVTRTDTDAMRRTCKQAELQRTKQVGVGDGATSLAQRTLSPNAARPYCPWLLQTRLIIWELYSGAFCWPLILQTGSGSSGLA